MRIYIVGYMGSGKSKAAEALAKLFKFDVVDTDRQIEARKKKTISQIFESEGLESFREIEKEILRSTEKSNNLIVATGGGAASYLDNMEWMNNNGITVYLEANPGLLFHRLATSKAGRPLIEKLNDVELMEQINGHLALRIPAYKKADVIVNAADLNPKILAEKIKSVAKSKSA